MKQYLEDVRLISAVILVLMVIAVSACFAETQLYHATDRYSPSDPQPVSVYGMPVGSSGTAAIRIPDTFQPGSAKLALLWLIVDDIDSPKETGIYLNGHSRMDPPQSLIGEGPGFKGQIVLRQEDLKPGVNEIKFVFEDNLNGTTRGFLILEAAILLVRSGPALPIESIPPPRDMYLTVPDLGTLAIYDSALEPRRLKMPRGPELGWKEHPIRKGDGKGGWVYKRGEFQFLNALVGKQLMPFGLAQMDNGEVILLAGWNYGDGERPVVALSRDRGNTWSDWYILTRAYGRPMMLAYLGDGQLSFMTDQRFFSKDYGRTWPERVPVKPAPGGSYWGTEGNPLVDRDAKGHVVRVAETGYCFGSEGYIPEKPTPEFIRWSTDGGRTWGSESSPDAWRWTETYQGKTYTRGVSEGALVRAKNGWIVAALRTDMSPRYFAAGPNDNVEGCGYSLSKDDGRTWSPVKVLFDAGRMHPHLLRLKNGVLVMGYIVRQDIRNGDGYASYRRGCEAILSRDNGLTWDLERKYVLDGFEHATPEEGIGALACGHTCSTVLDNGEILSAYGHYTSKSIALIRWRP